VVDAVKRRAACISNLKALMPERDIAAHAL